MFFDPQRKGRGPAKVVAACGRVHSRQPPCTRLNVAGGWTFLWLAIVMAAGPPSLRAQERSDEYQLKAAFVFNFIRFVDWPENLGTLDSLEVCVLARDAVVDAFGALDGRRVRDRTLALRNLSTTDETSTCRVIFVGREVSPQLPDRLPTTSGAPVLTVGETDTFIQDGGIIAFARHADRIRFAVNLDASERVGITIRSDLLRLASSVRPARQNR